METNAPGETDDATKLAPFTTLAANGCMIPASAKLPVLQTFTTILPAALRSYTDAGWQSVAASTQAFDAVSHRNSFSVLASPGALYPRFTVIPCGTDVTGDH